MIERTITTHDDHGCAVFTTTQPNVAFPDFVHGGVFIVENLEPGERRLIVVNGRSIIIFREQIH